MNKSSPSLIVAVSGGVDSVVMLHMLATGEQYKVGGRKYKGEKRLPRYPLPATRYTTSRSRLIVAHAEHGMRPDSRADARFVRALAEQYNVKFEMRGLGLREETSEEEARTARHTFLREISHEYQDAPIATAHHQDDLLETAIINVLRGTGRHGMSSLQTNATYVRPLLGWNREQIYEYAARQRLEWVEDETNTTDRFLRNRIRHQLISRLRQQGDDQRLLSLAAWFTRYNPLVDRLLSSLLDSLSERTADHLALDKLAFGKLPAIVQTALVHHVLRELRVRELDRHLVDDITAFVNNAASGKRFTQATPLLVIQSPDWALFQTSY